MNATEKSDQGGKESQRMVFAMSGGTCRTVVEVVQAGLAQFEAPEVDIVQHPKIRSVAAALKVVQEAAATGAILFHSLVDPKVREAVARQTQIEHVPTVDILGPALSALSDHLGRAPRRQPGLSYQLKREYYERVDAVNFTLTHDDGCAARELDRADVVLIGPSRVAKSATCFYLAYRGIRAANYPLLPDRKPPDELLQVDKSRVVLLTMNARRLQSIRRERVRVLGSGPFGEYTDHDTIRRELNEAARLAARQGWQSIDVSYKSVEEVARDVIAMLGETPRRPEISEKAT